MCSVYICPSCYDSSFRMEAQKNFKFEELKLTCATPPFLSRASSKHSVKRAQSAGHTFNSWQDCFHYTTWQVVHACASVTKQYNLVPAKLQWWLAAGKLKAWLQAAVSCNDMLQFYVGVIRPVLEYAVGAWHTSLSLEMSDQLELLQKHALRIIYGGSHFNSDSYASYCAELGIETLRVRRDLFFIGSSSQPAACII